MGKTAIIDVHLLELSQLVDGIVAAAPGMLSAELVAGRYRSRALDSALPVMARAEALASGLLLAGVLNISDDGQLEFDAAGKPRIAHGGPAFSLSHGGSLAVLAVSAPESAGDDAADIGVDVEPIASYNQAAAHRVLAADECAWIEAVADERNRAARFARAWTRLEAILKADGCGFTKDPRFESLPFGWQVASAEVEGHVIACAARGIPILRIHHFAVLRP